ncbi:hypothetical protein [Cyclobacterium plantarum]|uniref:Uncharacterized protein n=1 Tax=Cyclobacterium plantarum TaxID=2716263 RepID=A0ABX0HEU4_9BACT|nr:hypothetical protein [Cyclobacterium plantarum]NHE59057.1 hypothetical protein [Cyclobacterium plantarum]
MATTVKIIEYGTPNELTLDSFQRKLFLNELRRVQGSGISVFFKNLFAQMRKSTRPILIRPDCQIIIDTNGQVTEYFLQGKFVLCKKGSRLNHQFYMGVLLEHWLGMLP